MIISELITKLIAIKEKHGDIPVLVVDHGMGGYAVNTTGKISEANISPYDFEEDGGYDFDDDPEEFEKFKNKFKEFGFTEPSNKVKCVEIHSSTTIYAS